METTKVALENERKIQQLQMQAINALWKKVSTMQPNPSAPNVPHEVIGSAIGHQIADNHSQAIVQDLAKTCTVLTNQVQQLQGSMHDILQCMTVFCKLPQQPETVDRAAPGSANTRGSAGSCSTQTEIIAVHTPQVDNPPFPFRANQKLQRPSTLPLDANMQTSPQPPAMAQIVEDDMPRQMNTFNMDDDNETEGDEHKLAALSMVSHEDE